MQIMDDFLLDDTWDKFSQSRRWNKPHTSFLKIDSTPKDLFDQIAFNIWGWYIKKYKPQNVVGIETWINRADGNTKEPLPWHRDRDEAHFNNTGENIHPMAGIVLYGHKSIPTGGYLEIQREHGSELIEPVPNRLIVFDSSVWHRVTPMTSGTRLTLASNLWDRHPKPWR